MPLFSSPGVTTITSPSFFRCFARMNKPIELMPSSLITSMVGNLVPQIALDMMFRYFRVFLRSGNVFVLDVTSLL